MGILRNIDFKGITGADISEEVQRAAEQLSALVQDKKQRRARKLSDVLLEINNDLFGGGPDLSLSTGIKTLDNLLDGIEPKDLVTIAAPTGVGKTTFALKIMANMAKQGKKIMLYSQEMSDKQNAVRMIAKEASINLYKLKKPGRLDDKEIETIAETLAKLAKLPIIIKDFGGIKVDDIRLDCVKYKDLDCIFVDHVGLMKSLKKSSRYEEVTQIMIDLRALAMDICKPIIVLSQFNRDAMKKSEPDLQCFRDSGEIETSSSSAILLWRTPNYENDHIIGVKVPKNRQGESGRFYMRFDAHVMDFVEVDESRVADSAKWQKANKDEIKEIFGK
jgi:replicative DNA helicase